QVFVVRTLRTITFVSEFPFRKIQLILRLYKTAAEVLHGFDVDACSVGFDGHTVWATNRAARAICKQYNMVDLDYRSPSYETRLFKYGKRGYTSLLPFLEVDCIKPSLLVNGIHPGRAHEERGLAKMIALDSSFCKYHLERTTWGGFRRRWNEGLLHGLREDSVDNTTIYHDQTVRESDYTTMFIPYGPGWTVNRTWRHVETYCSRLNSWYFRMTVRD
ncbi:unnamed protein product, partial [Choristocarpus tenellus]